MTQLLLQDVKNHYKLLNHKGLWSQVHAQDKQHNRQIDRQLLQGEQELTSWVTKFNGQGDLYIGHNPRTKDGKVAFVSTLYIDIDPVRPKDTASTPEQLQEAIKAAAYLSSKDPYRHCIRASSGNGVHIYWPLERKWEVGQQSIKEFESQIRKLLEEKFNVKVDAVHDSPRLVKIIGTKATKGEPRLQRLSRFLHPINWGRLFDQGIFERLRSYPEAQQIGGSTVIVKENVTDRSAADFRLAVQLLKGGSSYEDTCSYLKSRGYKAPEREDSYTINTVLRAQSSINSSKQSVGQAYQEDRDRKPIEIFTPASHFKEWTENLDQLKEMELPTTFDTLDSYTGGLKKGAVCVVGARPNIGKTGYCVTVANNLLKQGKRVLVFYTESGWENCFSRFASLGTGVKLHHITDKRHLLTREDKRKLKEYAGTFESQPLHIIQESSLSVGAIDEAVARIRPDVFIFDYIQHVEDSGDNRHRVIGRFIRGMEDVAKKHSCAAVIASQLNRGADIETPGVRHLSESSIIEQVAHSIIILSKVSDGLVLGDLQKNRGPKGLFELKIDETTAEFKELTHGMQSNNSLNR